MVWPCDRGFSPTRAAPTYLALSPAKQGPPTCIPSTAALVSIPTASTLGVGRRPASLAGSHVSLPFGGATAAPVFATLVHLPEHIAGGADKRRKLKHLIQRSQLPNTQQSTVFQKVHLFQANVRQNKNDVET